MIKIDEKNKGKVRAINSINSQQGMRGAFNGGQRADLQKKAGLSPAQVEQLANVLPAIKQRLKPPIPSSRVREELSKLKKALIRIRKMPERPAGGEACARLNQAMMLMTRNPHEMVPLQNLIETANAAEKAVDDAIAGLPKYRGKIRRSSPKLSGSGELITLILRALQTEHATRRRGPSNMQSVPPVDIDVGHKRFSIIAGIVRDATGSWSVGEAIKNYRSNIKVIAAEERRIERSQKEELRAAIGGASSGGKSPKESRGSPKTK